jgi:hypothetical protein
MSAIIVLNINNNANGGWELKEEPWKSIANVKKLYELCIFSTFFANPIAKD